MPTPIEIFDHWRLALARLTDVFHKNDNTFLDNFSDGIFPGDDYEIFDILCTSTWTEIDKELNGSFVSPGGPGDTSLSFCRYVKYFPLGTPIQIDIEWEQDFPAVAGLQHTEGGIVIHDVDHPGDIYAGIVRKRTALADTIETGIQRGAADPQEVITIPYTGDAGMFRIEWDGVTVTLKYKTVAANTWNTLASKSGLESTLMAANMFINSSSGANAGLKFKRFEVTNQTGAKRIQRSLLIYSKQIQELETVYFQLLNERDIDNAIGAQLDVIGVILNLRRKSGQTDASYRARLKVQIDILKSCGEPERLISILNAMISPSFILLAEHFPGAVSLTFAGTVLSREELHDMLQGAAVGGVRIDLIQVDPDDAFAFEGPGAGLDGFGILADPTAGGLFSTLVE